jgi:hypothetical protein
MNRTDKRAIGENTYSTTRFSVSDALSIKIDLLRLLGPAIGSALAGITFGKGLETAVNGKSLAEGIQQLFQQIDSNSFNDMLKRLLKNTQAEVIVEGKKKIIAFTDQNYEIMLDIAFSGHIMDIYMVIGFILEVNFPDFFGQIKQRFGKLMEKTDISTQGTGSTEGS